MGSLFRSPKPPEPPPPPAEQDYLDLINKVQKRTVTRPDGTKQTVIESLPLEPAEQELVDQYTRLAKQNLEQFEYLRSVSAAIDIPEFKPVVDAVREQQRLAREQAFAETTRAVEDETARRGLSDSTAAVQARTSLASALNQQVRSDANQVALIAEDLRTQRLNEAIGGFGLAQGALEQQRGARTQAAQFGAQFANAAQATQGGLANNAYALQVDAFRNRPASPFQQLLGAASGLGTAYLLGGGRLGSLFGGSSAAAAGAATPALAPIGSDSGLFPVARLRTRV